MDEQLGFTPPKNLEEDLKRLKRAQRMTEIDQKRNRYLQATEDFFNASEAVREHRDRERGVREMADARIRVLATKKVYLDAVEAMNK